MIFLNWKANGNKNLIEEFKTLSLDKNFVVMPPHHLLSSKFGTITIGSQSVSQFNNGSYTGEITAQMLSDVNAKYCLVGHSERRNHYKENNESLSKQITNLINYNITPILCIGENSAERQNNTYFNVLNNQLSICRKECIIAYEPIWSIGTGLIPTNQEIIEIKNFIKNSYNNPKVLYGGSVNASNIKAILSTEVDGTLIGAASIKIDEVKQIQQIIQNR
jgi:triosephosphate isomerase